MNSKGKLVVGMLTAVAMFLLTFALSRGGPLRDAALVQFPLTVGVVDFRFAICETEVAGEFPGSNDDRKSWEVTRNPQGLRQISAPRSV